LVERFPHHRFCLPAFSSSECGIGSKETPSPGHAGIKPAATSKPVAAGFMPAFPGAGAFLKEVSMTSRSKPFAVLSLILLIASPVFSQAPTGAITGRALDESGAIVPGVDVTISSPAMIGGTRMAPTDEQGSYRFTQLPAGVYRVTFALPGFKTMNIDGVEVTVGNTITINGTMTVAAIAEDVTVVSQVPTIDLEAASVGLNWGQDKLVDLPWGKSIRGLAAMIPGMFAATYDVGGSTMGGSATLSGNVYGRSGGESRTYD